MRAVSLLMGLLALSVFGVPVRADPVFFVDDYAGFVEAAGDVQTIDFETLPDGSPGIAGTEITPDFNYTDQGVTFSSPRPRLYTVGNSVTGFGLMAESYPEFDPNWIIADFVTPAFAAGIVPVSSTTLSVFDLSGDLIASRRHGCAGPGCFLGIVSEVPIASGMIDGETYHISIGVFHYAPVPVPGSLILVLVGAGVLHARARRGLNK